MIARPVQVNASKWSRWQRACVRLSPALLLLAVACKKKPKPFPPAPRLSTATTEGASVAVADGGRVPVPVGGAIAAPAKVPAPAPVPAPASPPTTPPADRAALDQTKALVQELEALVKRGALTSRDKPDDVDATEKCSAGEPARRRLETLADPEATKLATDLHRLCAYDVPLVSADHALKQLSLSGSQASRRLMCGIAAKDLDTARAARNPDRRLREIDARWARACK